MVALDPKFKKSSALNHLVVGLLIVGIALHVLQIPSDLAAANGEYNISKIRHNKEGNNRWKRNKFFISDGCEDEAD
jgi:hypothetical protein